MGHAVPPSRRETPALAEACEAVKGWPPGDPAEIIVTCDSASYITLTYDPCARAQRAETPDFVTLTIDHFGSA
jgi:hypothetical protein